MKEYNVKIKGLTPYMQHRIPEYGDIDTFSYSVPPETESGEKAANPFNTHPARNFPEDYEQENGNYINTCSVCKLPFRGNKHRVWCRMCDEPNWEELSKIQKPEINSPPMAGCWLQGEMVGFARCMVKRVKPLQEEIARLKAVSPPTQAESRWISVDDEWPLETMPVLWCHDPVEEPYIVASLLDEGFDENQYTHWMPLPEPPITRKAKP